MSKTPEEIAAEAKQAADAAALAEQEKNKSTTVDFKAELEKTQKELLQAQHKIVELKKDSKKVPPAGDAGDDDGDSNKQEDIREVIKSAMSEQRIADAEESIDAFIGELASNEDERKLIRLIYDKKIVKSGHTKEQIKRDLIAATAIANAPKLEVKIKEIAEAAKAKPNSTAAGQGGGSFGSDSSSGAQIKWNATDTAFLKQYGIDPSKA